VNAARIIILLVACAAGAAQAAEVIPPVPPKHFNDYAGVVSSDVAARLDRKLADFEKQTSNQIVVAIYPQMQTDSSIEDYTVRVAQRWGVGQKDRRNGAVLFVFPKDRKMFLQVGYGLEGALPDATAKQIIEREIKPHFAAGDFAGGLSSGVDAILAATRGEYTAKPRSAGGEKLFWLVFVLLVIFVIAIIVMAKRSGPVVYTRNGRYRSRGPIFIPTGGWGRGGGGSWGGGGFGGGGGGFSAGGGSFGGGGAGGSW